jgi:hypothetical protein
MKTAKKSATAKNIDAINRYLQNVADIWTIYSNEYEKATAKVKDFDIRTNKNGVIQIKNTKANRKKHQKIRAIKNTIKSKNIIQRNYNKRTKGLTKKDIQAIKTFEDDVSNAYKKLKELQEKYELDITPYLERLRRGEDTHEIIADALLEVEMKKELQNSDYEKRNTIETDFGIVDADTGELIYEF